ncbi:T9SS response regulator signal transducer PorX [Prevotella melaninogenica]|uniref:T9SS response regulator signal transducer PorX n=1 Tax=Prevotella melaninogenica TaxID=28132 RepID=UPI001C5EBB8F|nr:bifunctional response regulator/alkaline phosphatase family protein [Prevotella melaninogenica]MBW4733275.1 PglZ domain-containing protein [Prevotella melaninogenica]MBW4735777.1 PglZ domain-containing protein [Prevotella melaninogenica]MBW4878336.1 PglZ domain-containing protein [Prevotella melaninogenica]
MSNGLLLWVDDEIELLKAHIIFLEKKGYEVVTVSNGTDAIDQCQTQTFDLVLLDEQMPGLSGLETLQRIKEIQPATPIVMVTKSEEEDIMNQAIGAKIADYLIKPVNPNQILLTLKKNIHQKEIVTEVTQSGYQQNYQQIAMQISDCRTFNDWKDVYRKLVHWELELSSADSNMTEMLKMQKEEANNGFAKYIAKNYLDWVAPQDNKVSNRFSKLAGQKKQQTNNDDNRPLLSTDIFKSKVFPLIDKGEKVFLIVIDNFRLDQWRILSKEIGDMFDIEEDLYMSILPTATQYARNAIFSGLMPKQIATMFPELWVDEDEEEGKNLNEEPLIQTQIDRYRRHDKFSYHKINNSTGADKFMQQYKNLAQNDLNVLVVNFVDMLSHARTEMRMIRELASNESAYRSITLSWFQHSVLADVFKELAQSDYKVIITTDHGSIRTTNPVKIIGDRNTNTNLRYKLGKSLNYDARQVFAIKNPHLAQLPAPNLSTSYVFATGDSFFAYPNNYNYYVSYYKDTFQHGGISMEEMIVPLATLSPRKR